MPENYEVVEKKTGRIVRFPNRKTPPTRVDIMAALASQEEENQTRMRESETENIPLSTGKEFDTNRPAPPHKPLIPGKTGSALETAVEPFNVFDPNQYHPIESLKKAFKAAPQIISGEGGGEYPRIRAIGETLSGVGGAIGFPAAVAGSLIAPETIPIIGAAGHAGSLATEGLRKLGGPPEVSELGGQLTGLAVGAGLGYGAARSVPRPAEPMAPVEPITPPKQIPTAGRPQPSPGFQPGVAEGEVVSPDPTSATRVAGGVQPKQLPVSQQPARTPSGAIPLGTAPRQIEAPPATPLLETGTIAPKVGGALPMPGPVQPLLETQGRVFQQPPPGGAGVPALRGEQLPATIPKAASTPSEQLPESLPEVQSIQSETPLSQIRISNYPREIQDAYSRWERSSTIPEERSNLVDLAQAFRDNGIGKNELDQYFRDLNISEDFIPDVLRKVYGRSQDLPEVQSIQPEPGPVESLAPKGQDFSNELTKISQNPTDRTAIEMGVAKAQASGISPDDIRSALQDSGVAPYVIDSTMNKFFGERPAEEESEFRFPTEGKKLPSGFSPEGQTLTEGPRARGQTRKSRFFGSERGSLSFPGRSRGGETMATNYPDPTKPSVTQGVHAYIGSGDQYLSENPHTKPVADAWHAAKLSEDEFAIQMEGQLGKALSGMGSDFIKKKGFQILNGEAQPSTPKEAQAATALRESLDQLFDAGVEGGLEKKGGGRPQYLKDYITHIVKHPDVVDAALEDIGNLFQGKFNKSALLKRAFGKSEEKVGVDLGEDIGRKPGGTPRTPFIEKRTGTNLPLNTNLQQLLPTLVRSYARAIYRKQFVDQARPIIARLPESFDKTFSTEYVNKAAGLETNSPLERLDRTLASMGAQSQLGFSTDLQLLHAMRFIVQSVPEIGERYALEGLARALNPFEMKAAITRARDSGLLPMYSRPWNLKGPMEKLNVFSQLGDIGRTFADVATHEGMRAKLRNSPIPNWEDQAAIETKRIVGLGDVGSQAKIFDKIPRFFMQYQNYKQKWGENIARSLFKGIRDKDATELMKFGRYLFYGYIAYLAAEETGLKLFHLGVRGKGHLVDIGSTASKVAFKVGSDLWKGDFAGAFEEMGKFVIPGGQYLDRKTRTSSSDQEVQELQEVQPVEIQ